MRLARRWRQLAANCPDQPRLQGDFRNTFNRSLSLFFKVSSTLRTYGLTSVAQGTTGGVDRSIAMRQLFARFVDDKSGATAIEYCLIAAGLSIVIVTAVNGVGLALSGKFTSISTSLK
jgi:pilus assembly protein Flp/PilA